MEMTEREIISSYKGAKNKAQQINILADLNCTTTARIKEIVGLKKEELVKSEVEKIDEYAAMQKKIKPKHIQEEESVKAAELTIKIPDSIYNMAVTRLEELENILENARKEYAEIAEFLGMGA